ncbi:hypothetical protein ZHAS_00004654 [Anopheles sinensis]|uniref:Uncharacterized protein n=1 Tax=Anopheles sinensis TaxID=74873 RepID=A0A084VHB5_ANOSI|nr:hypothetical protein ZHAS_00004654 [Anopheles sinensis]
MIGKPTAPLRTDCHYRLQGSDRNKMKTYGALLIVALILAMPSPSGGIALGTTIASEGFNVSQDRFDPNGDGTPTNEAMISQEPQVSNRYWY